MGTGWFAAGVAIAVGLLVAGFTYCGSLLIAPYRQRDEVRTKIGVTPSTPRRGAASLQIVNIDCEFGISGKPRFEALTVPDGVQLIRVSGLLVSSGHLTFERASLALAGERIEALDCRTDTIWPGVSKSPLFTFHLPAWASHGEHRAELLVFAQEEWWTSDTFTFEI